MDVQSASALINLRSAIDTADKKHDDMKKRLEETKESKAQLEQQNEKLKREMGLLRRNYLLSQNCIHELQATLDRHQKKLADLERGMNNNK